MKKTTPATERRRGLRMLEVATVCAVLGILASLAIPSILRMQARSRVERLLAAARSCRQDLPEWVAASVPNQASASDSEREGSAFCVPDARNVLEDYARTNNDRFRRKGPAEQGPLLVVEPTGTDPSACARDGRIHIIPLVDPTLPGIGARLVVTDEHRIGGVGYEGILAVYNVEAGRSE
jgi:type II secretory pathway pseudopilin PulG